MLRALAKRLRPGGRIAFTTIRLAPDLSPAERRRARLDGPRAVSSRASLTQLLERAGFVDVDDIDLTDSFVTTQRRWLDARTRHYAELAAIEAPGALDQRLADNRAQLAATEVGLLRRSMLSATRG